MLDVGGDACRDGVAGDDESYEDEKFRAEISIVRSLLSVVSDGSPLVRAEVAVGMEWLLKFVLLVLGLLYSSWFFVVVVACDFSFLYLLVLWLSPHTKRIIFFPMVKYWLLFLNIFSKIFF